MLYNILPMSCGCAIFVGVNGDIAGHVKTRKNDMDKKLEILKIIVKHARVKKKTEKI